MLEDVSKLGQEHIVSWQPHGRAFRVHKPNDFLSFILPRYFKQTQYKSFQRQLYTYGFKRISGKTMRDCGAYYHEDFVRGQQQKAMKIMRIKLSKQQISRQQEGNPMMELLKSSTTIMEEWVSFLDGPNFYADTGAVSDAGAVSATPVVATSNHLSLQKNTRNLSSVPIMIESRISSVENEYRTTKPFTEHLTQKKKNEGAKSSYSILMLSRTTCKTKPSAVVSKSTLSDTSCAMMPSTLEWLQQRAPKNASSSLLSKTSLDDNNDSALFFEGKQFFSVDDNAATLFCG